MYLLHVNVEESISYRDFFKRDNAMTNSEVSCAIGKSFSKDLLLTKEDIIEQAAFCGDENFIHHDEDRSLNTRFGGVIASGSAISSIYSAMIPTYFSKIANILGLEMSFQFKAPIYPDIRYSMSWMIESVAGDLNGTGKIVCLTGTIRDSEQKTQVMAQAKIMLLSTL
ncbi:MAG: acyl dehydratase [Gammaproteobacteria bacterium]|mgnify:CR=1 FL=1|jgi:acyl dehydratase